MTDVVDFHAHFFARPFFDALAEQSPLAGSPAERLARVVDATGIELPPDDVAAHLARWIGELDAEGCAHLVAFASAPEEIPAVAEAAAASDGRLTPMAVCDPTRPGAAEKVEALLAGRGFRGVLLFPAMHHYSPADEVCAPVFEALARHRAVAYVHCGLLVVKLRDLLGLPRAYDLRGANPLDVVAAAGRHPEATFCLPHFGGGFFREALLAGAQCPNVVVDTSSSNGWTRTHPTPLSLRDVFARSLDVFGPERVLFGTDSNVFPAGWRRDRLDEQAAVLDELGLSPDERAAVLGASARRLLSR